MKKGLIIGGSILGVILLILIAIPIFFSSQLLEKTKSIINNNINATVEFQDFKLSLLQDFPKASLSMKNVSVTGKGSFSGDTLLEIGALRTSFSLFDLFGSELAINEIILDNATLTLLVNEQQQTNWSIVPEDGKTETASTAGESSMNLKLNEIVINNANVHYTDASLPMQIDLENINMNIAGKMYGSSTNLNVEGDAARFNVAYDNVNYISKIKLGLKTILDMNFDKMDFRITEGIAMLNNLPLDMNGSFSMPNDSLFFDLDFASKASTLAEILALVPPEYESYLADLKASGNASFNGFFKGYMYEESYPALNVLLQLSEGNARYEGMPEEIKKINGKLQIEKPQGNLNSMVVNVTNAHFEVRGNPLDLNANLRNLLEDMHFKGSVAGKLNFDHLKDVLPLDSMDVSGLLDINLGVEGYYSAIENERYERLKTEGAILLDDFVYSGKDLSLPIQVSSGKMVFSPEKIDLLEFIMKIGQSNLSIAGSLRDYYPYFFSGGILKGAVNLNSDYLNLNQLMMLSTDHETVTANNEKSKTAAENPESPSVFKVPEQINLSVQANVKKALYEQLNIQNINGLLVVNDGKLDLRGVNMNMLNGEIKLSGSYANTSEAKPLVDMNIDLVNLDIPAAFQSLGLVRTYLPVAMHSKGSFSTSLNLKGQFDEKMNFLMSSLNGNGLLKSENVQILNSPVFNKIKSVLNEDKLRDIRIDDFAANFSIENGNLLLKPFNAKIAGQQATFTGHLNFDDIIDLDVDFLVNRDALSSNIENTIGLIPGQKNIQQIPVGLKIKGPVNNPKVDVDLTKAKDLVVQSLKSSSKEELQKAADKIKNLFK